MIRIEVECFAEAMEERLRENDHKDHWSNYTPLQMFELLRGEVEELAWAFTSEEKASECVDIANFAMMIWDLLEQGEDGQCGKYLEP